MSDKSRAETLEAQLAEAQRDTARLEWLIALFRKQPDGLNLWHNPSLARSQKYADSCWGLERIGWSYRDGEPTQDRLSTGATAREAIDAAMAREGSGDGE